MKQIDKVIRNGDYYELETMEDIIFQQKASKKEDIPSSTLISPSLNILTQLPSREQAYSSYFVPASSAIRTQDLGLNQHQTSLQDLLRHSIRDEERLEIEKLLRQIAEIKNDGELPLNKMSAEPYNKPEQAKSIPKEIVLRASVKTDHIKEDIEEMEKMKIMELSRLEHLVEILIGEMKVESPSPQPSQLEEKVRAEIESTYNNMNKLSCLKGLPEILNKIAANEVKYVEMSEWVSRTEDISDLNKEILDEFEHDELVLKQLQQSFKQNVSAVRSAIGKLNE